MYVVPSSGSLSCEADMGSLNTVIVESACVIANEIGAHALFVYADAIQDYPIPSGMLDATDIILITHSESRTEPSAGGLRHPAPAAHSTHPHGTDPSSPWLWRCPRATSPRGTRSSA